VKRLLYPLLFISVLIYWGCEDKDTTPTEVTLWGVDYSVEETYTLDLSYNQLTGSIPPEIGNLTNLTHLYLNDNQLSGIIPDEICNQGDSSPSLYNNQLCPPYPSCIEDYVGTQDTSDCD
jgi:hypothetical protein